MKNITFPQYKTVIPYFLMSGFLVQWNVVRLEMIFSVSMHQKQYKVKQEYAEKSANPLVYKYRVDIGAEIYNYQFKELLLKNFKFI